MTATFPETSEPQRAEAITLREFLVFQAIVIGGIFIISNAIALIGGDLHFPQSLIYRIISFGFLFVVTCAIHVVFRYLNPRGLAARSIAALPALLFMPIILMAGDILMEFVFMWMAGETMATPSRIALSRYYFFNLALFAGWLGAYLAFLTNADLRFEENRRHRLEAMANEAQLTMLRYQLNPHFLFNTLNAISSLILDNRNDAAETMVGRLSGFLRYTLAGTLERTVTLETEIETQKLYLEIEKARFGPKLKTVFRIEDEALKARVPSLIIQPIVENAIKYAVAPRQDGAQINIAARRNEDRLIIVIEDDGPGFGRALEDIHATHVGLKNTAERLNLHYPGQARLHMADNPAGGARVTLEMPFETDAV